MGESKIKTSSIMLGDILFGWNKLDHVSFEIL